MKPVFDADRCTRCGECFHQCPVMQLPLERAKEEIGKLIDGESSTHVLERCESCFACDFICPEGCNPTRLILDRWFDLYRREGFPKRAAYFIPHSPNNFRTDALEKLPEDERELLRTWDDPSPRDEIFYPGCNWITVPALARTKLLEGIAIRGSLELCCGEMYYRMGLYDQVRQVARRLTAHFRDMGLKRMIIPCTAGLNMFTNVLPRFGAEFSFEIRHMLPWLLERVESGDIAITSPFDMTGTIQESCYAKFMGDDFMEIPRKLLAKIGISVIEEDPGRSRALCCGIGGGFSHASAFHPLNLIRSTLRSLETARKTGADVLVTYCAGCLQMLGAGQLYFPPARMPLYHILELVRMAAGEEVERESVRRGAVNMFLGTLRNQTPSLFSARRYRIKEIT
ncbi:MAG: (Fe-S)-binding protein [Deltaproteobacteria bacterium]|nr:(Fe-S)-binding protein [Deltaproteobacteria bacterium]